MSQVRVPSNVSEPLSDGVPNIRVPATVSEPLAEGAPNVRTDAIVSEPLSEGYPNLRVALIIAEALIPVPDGPFMSNAVFPALKGLTWTVHKAPGFMTLTAKHSSGRQTRSALMANPIWTFTLTYEFLADRTSGLTDLKTLLGFFLARQGAFDTFLYQDASTPDFCLTGATMATADGVTLQWPLVRAMSSFEEPIGQLDTTVLASFANTAVNTGTNLVNVANHGLTADVGPVAISTTGTVPGGLSVNTTYWLAVPDANHFGFATSKANAIAGTLITLTSQGTGTHKVARDIAVYDNGTLLDKTSYSITMPNQLVFVVAPSAAHAITADFQFFYVCHFTTDSQDYEEFASRLWTLQKCEFESIIP